MELGNTVIIVTLRSALRFAWAIARAARALGALGERLEGAVERHAQRRQVDIDEVLAPLIADIIA